MYHAVMFGYGRLGFVISLLGMLPGSAQSAARLVVDLAPEFDTTPLYVSQPVMAGGKAFFSAITQEHGAELWVSSGVVPGTGQLVDIYPGFGSSAPGPMMEMAGKMYFVADDGTHGRELWVSDGTAAGTTMVVDLFPGANGSAPIPLATTSGKLWFAAETDTGRGGLWCTDGTAANTVELNPVLAATRDRAYLPPPHYSILNGIFYFASGTRIYKSDGTLEGTVPIEILPALEGHTQVNDVETVGDAIYYIVSNNFREWLWRTNGEAGNAVMIPREPGTETWQVLSGLLSVGGKVSFFGQTELGTKPDWYCGDGTIDGSVRFDHETLGRWNEESFTIGDIVYFGITNASKGGELCRSDGTLKGTYVVKDIRPGPRHSAPFNFCVAGKWLYFTADDGKKGREIWRTDGTEKGTRLVFETVPGSGSTLPEKFAADGEAIYFTGGQLSPGRDLWRTDGTKAGTVRLTIPEQKGVGGMKPSLGYRRPIAALGKQVFFNFTNPKLGSELWTSDGTAKGTRLVIDAIRGTSSSEPEFLTPMGNRMLFATNPVFEPEQLWSSSGTKSGTKPLTGDSAGANPQDFTRDGNRTFFTCSQEDTSLWVTDGTKKGTREIAIQGNTPLNVVRGTLRMAGTTLFFAHDRRPVRHELWRSDGTPQGTTMVRDAFPAAANGEKPRLDHFTAVGTSICFFSETGNLSRLWRSDGTNGGTLEVTLDFAPGNHFRVLTAIPFGDQFLFLADAENGGLKWWISDGTTAGTRILKDRALGPAPDLQAGQAPKHAVINGILFLVINTQAEGTELWRTDGTEEGTTLVVDLMPGAAGSNPAELLPIGDRLYFAASNVVHGRELWSTDGTAEGTLIAAEVMPGDRSSSPAMLCAAGNQLFFAAENPVAGYELHALDLPPNAGGLAGKTARSRDATQTGEAGKGSSVMEGGDALLRLAFNLDPADTGRPHLQSGTGTSGYPVFSWGEGVFRVEYVRRRDGRFIYTPKWSATLEAESFVPMTGPEVIVDIDDEWERVTVEQPILPGTTRMFGLVEVTGT